MPRRPGTPVHRPCSASFCTALQGYLAHTTLPPPRTIQKAYAKGPRAVLGGDALVLFYIFFFLITLNPRVERYEPTTESLNNFVKKFFTN